MYSREEDEVGADRAPFADYLRELFLWEQQHDYPSPEVVVADSSSFE